MRFIPAPAGRGGAERGILAALAGDAAAQAGGTHLEGPP